MEVSVLSPGLMLTVAAPTDSSVNVTVSPSTFASNAACTNVGGGDAGGGGVGAGDGTGVGAGVGSGVGGGVSEGGGVDPSGGGGGGVSAGGGLTTGGGVTTASAEIVILTSLSSVKV